MKIVTFAVAFILMNVCLAARAQAQSDSQARTRSVHVVNASWAWTVPEIDVGAAKKRAFQSAIDSCAPLNANLVDDWIVHPFSQADHSEWIQLSEEGGCMMYPWEIQVEATFECR